MQEQNNNKLIKINYLSASYKRQLLQKLLQQGQVSIFDFKISTKILSVSSNVNHQKIKKQLKRLIQMLVDQANLQDLHSQALPVVQQYKYYRFGLHQAKTDMRLSQSQSYYQYLKSISHINFSNLRTLCLSRCKLSNIQTITFINAPILSQLWICHSKISNTNALIKSHFPQLKKIYMDENCIQQAQKLSRFNVKKLEMLHLQSIILHSDNKHKIQDIRFLLKFNYQYRYKSIYLLHPDRNYHLVKNIINKLNRTNNTIHLINQHIIRH